nr:ribonuclease H-like domain-containing protein [Tanacetum cinerariifolium]
KLAPKSYASRDIRKYYAPMNQSKIPLHKISAATSTQFQPVLTIAARTVSAVKLKFSKTSPNIAPYVVSKSKSPLRRPFIRHPSPKPSISPPRVNAAKPSADNQFIHDPQKGNLQQALKDKGVIDSGCSSHMTRNMSYLSNFEELNRGYVAFGGNLKGGKITSKGKIKTGNDTECLVLSSDFKLPDASQMLLRVPRENNMYNVNLKNIIPSGDLTCLFAKDETASVLKTFIVGLENLLSLKVKIIRCNNGIEFKNTDLNQFYGLKGIKREFSIPRTPQKNGIAERKNMTLIEAARTLLADSLLPISF